MRADNPAAAVKRRGKFIRRGAAWQKMGTDIADQNIFCEFFAELSFSRKLVRRVGKRAAVRDFQPKSAKPKMSDFPNDRELVLTRVIDAPPERVYAAWTQPELMKKWFSPKPVETIVVETEVRVGGASRIVMRLPDGTEMPSRGVYLEVVPNRKLVFTDAFVSAWEPSAQPFMTVILTFEEQDGKTLYTARVRHWRVEDRERHENMGFHAGWGKATDQLAELVGGK